MQIERHRRTMGVHVTVNEPINTSFLLFNAFSEWMPSRRRTRISISSFRGKGEEKKSYEF